ncbi:hypothetical protein BC940DRAFT_338210 [Gongronella butleri]|nr:hypothetical protein BC940DRAFT_338210 [Gongronella butleri]
MHHSPSPRHRQRRENISSLDEELLELGIEVDVSTPAPAPALSPDVTPEVQQTHTSTWDHLQWRAKMVCALHYNALTKALVTALLHLCQQMALTLWRLLTKRHAVDPKWLSGGDNQALQTD